MKLNRKMVLVLALVLSVAMATTGTLAYLTDRDSAVNVFSTGNVVIELVEDGFDQNNENMLLPGTAIAKEPYVKNTGSVDAYVWVQVAAPAGALGTLGELASSATDGVGTTSSAAITLNGLTGTGWEYKEKQTNVEIKGTKCDVYTYKYNTTLAAKAETSKLFTSVSMSTDVDITPEGDVYSVVKGVATDLNYNINEGELPIYVSAYAIQAAEFDDFDAAYNACNSQWTTEDGANNGLEWGTASFKPSEGLDEKDNVVTLKSASDLMKFANEVNGGNYYSGQTVVLANDIDLKGAYLEPIGQPNYEFKGTFDGNGHTIKNFVIDESKLDKFGANSGVALFGSLNGTIKNLTIESATIKGYKNAAAICGYLYYGTIENCTVLNSNITATHYDDNRCGDKAGAVVAIINNGTAEKCYAKTCTITAARDAGQVVGMASASDAKVYYCWADDVTVTCDSTGCKDSGAGQNIKNEVIGRNLTSADKVKNVTTISTKDDLMNLSGKRVDGVIVLQNDIDMSSTIFNPIQVYTGDNVKLIGNNHTISNIDIGGNEMGFGMFFTYGNEIPCTLEINDLTISKASIDATKNAELDSHGSGIIVGYINSGSTVILNNVKIIDSSVKNTYVNDTNNGNKAGVFIGYVTTGQTVTMTNCESKGCSVAGRNDSYTGAYIGYVNENSLVTFTNCKTDLTIAKVGTVVNGATVTEKN